MTKTLVGTPDPEDNDREQAREKLKQRGEEAIATLQSLLGGHTDDGIRLAAAQAILDRARTKAGEYVLTATASATDNWRALQDINEEQLVASSEDITPRASILREAEGLITGDRNVSYGSPTQNFTNIAELWTTQFQHLLKDDAKFEPWHVADALILLKLARNISQAKRDNYVDLAGYAACGYETTLGESFDGPKILLVAGDVDGGCGHYRMREPARVAKINGIDLEVATDLATESYMTNGEITINSLDVGGADLVVFQRPVLHVFCSVIEHLQQRGVACAVELDDDIMAVHKHNMAFDAFNPASSPHSNWNHLNKACSMADLVITSTQSLADRYAPHGRSAIIRNRISAADINPDKEYSEKPRLGWSGTVQTHPEDLTVMGPHLRAAMGNAGITDFHVVGDGLMVDQQLGFKDSLRVRPTGWVPREDYIQTLADNLDVGVVPLKLDLFNAGKSWLKLLEMSSQGIPAVSSPTYENLLLAEITGTPVAHKQKDWQKHLTRLLTNRDYAIEMGSNARDAVSSMTYENAIGEWADAWMLAIENRAKHRIIGGGSPLGL